MKYSQQIAGWLECRFRNAQPIGDFQSIDWAAEWDETLTYAENIDNLEAKFGKLPTQAEAQAEVRSWKEQAEHYAKGGVEEETQTPTTELAKRAVKGGLITRFWPVFRRPCLHIFSGGFRRLKNN